MTIATRLLPRLLPRLRAVPLWVRLACGFGSLLALMLVVVVLAILQFRSLAAQGERVMSQDLQRMLRVQELHQHAQGHGNAMARLLTAPRVEREQIYPRIDAENEAVDVLLTGLVAQLPDERSAASLAQVVTRRGQYHEAFVEVVEALEAGDASQARATFNGSAQPALQALLDAAQALLAQEQAALADRQADVHQQIDRSEWLLAGLSAVALGLSTLLALRTTASVARPLRRVAEAANRIADGDYSVSVQVRSGDEIGRVAEAMNAMGAAVAAREAEIQSLAFVDRLTGLPNRTRLCQIARQSAPGGRTLILMDVARLRTVNEVLGFEIADALLVEVAGRLSTVVAASNAGGEGTVLARLAGGVFVALCPHRDRVAAEQLLAAIGAAMVQPVDCAAHAVDVNLVCGLADATCGPDDDAQGLLRCAELALVEAKRSRQASAWHVAADETARARQLSLLSGLRRAAAAGQLVMWMQPKQCLRSGRVLGMEGLVRWHHPQRGHISPAEFVPFAERTGHIGIVTAAMLDAALSTLARWRAAGRQMSIAVNVSALDIRDLAFVGRVEQIARRHQAPLDGLRLEITETSLMEDADRALPVLLALRKLGVRWSIDDFGTGYSSLAYLKRLPVDELKIDRSFVAGADLNGESRALLRTIVELGHSLNLSVTAEGIERPQELALLGELGCDMAQGYLISRPLDPAAAARYVARLELGSVDLVPA